MLDYIDILNIRKKAAQYITKNTEIREGQSVFLAANDLFPDKAQQLKNTNYDCFYDDDRIEIFLIQLQKL